MHKRGGSAAAVCGALKTPRPIGRAGGSKANGVDSHQLEAGDNVSLFRYLVAPEASVVLRARHRIVPKEKKHNL